MIAGNPGTGKTTLCSQFIYDGLATKDENGVYISFSESKTQFYANAERLGMDFNKFERLMKFTFLALPSLTKDGIQDALEEILATIGDTKAKRVVLDSFSAISLAFEDRSETRTTVQVLLGKCTIGNNGMILYPKQSLRLTYLASEERIISGIPGFDERISNGFIRGTTTAVIGAAGTAKSTFAFQYIAEGVRKNGEAGIFCTLEQSADEIRIMGKSYGYDMTQLEKDGLSILATSAEDQNPDAFIVNLASEIKRTKAKRLVIDNLSAFTHKYKNEIYTITRRIVSLIQEYQITAIVTILTTQKIGFEVTGLDLSSLLQNVILLRFVEVKGRMTRILLVLKTRESQHDESILEFKISKDKGGVEIIGPIDKEYIGLSTGMAQKVE